MPHLGELAVACGLFAVVLGGGVALGARDYAHGRALHDTMVAREAAEGLLELAQVRDLPAGRHVLPLADLPSAARLSEVSAVADVQPGPAGTRTLQVTLAWRAAAGARTVTLRTVVR